MTFRALLTERSDSGEVATRLTQFDDSDLMPGDVDIAVSWSGINYKDALAVTGTGQIMRRFPLVGGIDLAGTVTASRHPGVAVGDVVLGVGHELGQTHHGGFAEQARVPGEWLLPVPAPLTARDAMIIGTAGFTAALSVLALERGGLTPDRGDVVVTGASGGVGSFAVALLVARGYRVVASTSRVHDPDRLLAIGAAELLDRRQLSEPGRPFQSIRWAGAVDTVGSHTLANVLAATGFGGVVTCCGLAQGNDLPGSVLPFILRGVTLAGIDSVHVADELRRQAWARLASDLDRATLERTTDSQVGLADVVEASRRLLAGGVQGRIVVDVTA